MTFVEVKFECINWWGNEVYRTKNGTPICGGIECYCIAKKVY